MSPRRPVVLPRLLFGDNQFFGVNHMSEEKARRQMLAFQHLPQVMAVLEAARDAGVGGFMCTTHDRVAEIAEAVRSDPGAWQGFDFCPGMPYAHKYANALTECGPVEALRRFLPEQNLVESLVRGSRILFGRDVESLMHMLVDAEMKMFAGLSTPVVFLQNILTDLILGIGAHDLYRAFADYVSTRYDADAGFFTMNMPALLKALEGAGVANPIVCANINKREFRMSGGAIAYRRAADRYPARIIAMSVLASGAIPAREAIEWVYSQGYVRSIVFGASTRDNIVRTVDLVNQIGERPGPALTLSDAFPTC